MKLWHCVFSVKCVRSGGSGCPRQEYEDKLDALLQQLPEGWYYYPEYGLKVRVGKDRRRGTDMEHKHVLETLKPLLKEIVEGPLAEYKQVYGDYNDFSLTSQHGWLEVYDVDYLGNLL